jgi:hypothetical protein
MFISSNKDYRSGMLAGSYSNQKRSDMAYYEGIGSISGNRHYAVFQLQSKLLSRKGTHTRQLASQITSQATELILDSQATELAPPSRGLGPHSLI